MEDFVPFEIAKKLKEKGFGGLCLAYYTNDDTLYYNYSHKAGASYIDCYLSHNLMPKDSVSGKFIDAPIISQVLKWLREEYQIHIFVDVTSVGWIPKVSIKVKLDDTRYWFSKAPIESDFFDTYEEAIVAGIEYCLDNLI